MRILKRSIFPVIASCTLAMMVNGVLAADPDAGQQKFQQFCTTCHGENGQGDGPAAASLKPAPRDLSDAEWQASVDDQHILVVTRDGGAAAGLSPMMTPWGHSLSEEDLHNIVAYIRSLDD